MIRTELIPGHIEVRRPLIHDLFTGSLETGSVNWVSQINQILIEKKHPDSAIQR